MNKQDLEQMTEEEKAEYHESVKKKIDEMHEEVRKEREEKQRTKEERKEAKRLARQERRESRPMWARVLSLVAQWGVVILILAWIGSYHGDEIVAKLDGDNSYKSVVMDHTIEGSHSTVEDACNKFFIDGKYKAKYFQTSNKENVVEIKGNANLNGEKVNLILQFIPHSRNIGDYSVYTSIINNVPQNIYVTEGVYNELCSTVRETNKEQVKNVKEEDNTNDKVDNNNQAPVETDGYDFKASANTDNINSDNCVTSVQNTKVGNKTLTQGFNSLLQNVNWEFEGEENGSYDVAMYGDNLDAMYKIKIVFNITKDGTVTIPSAYRSDLDSTEGDEVSNENLATILTQAFIQ